MNEAETKQNSVTALFMAFGGFALLTVGDAIVKSMAGQWPGLAAGALRYSIAAMGLTIIMLCVAGPKALRMPKPSLQLARGAAVAIATFSFFTAMQFLPLATATTIQFTTPMLTAVLSAVFLKEKAPAAVWISISLAFMGVLVVLRPEVASVGPAALLPLTAAIGLAMLMILNRKAAALGLSVLAMQWTVAVAGASLLIPATVAGHFSGLDMFQVGMPHWTVILRYAAVAVTATTGYLLIYMATIRASAAVVAPMIYVQLLVAVIIGWVFFNAAPDAATLAGAALIIGGGLYLWDSQRRSGKREVTMTNPLD